MKLFTAFFSGLLFGTGLVISGMTLPENIVGFLDVLGEWKPALAFVMAGALGVYALLSRLVLRRSAPLYDLSFERPAAKEIDARLIAGAAVFGIGWGLGGFCPGPSVVALSSGVREAILFFVSMAAGMILFRFINSSSARPPDGSSCG